MAIRGITPKVRLLPLALVLLACAGCVVSRVRTNGRVEHLDTSWIVPGVTTHEEVVERLGLPPPAGRADDAPAYLSSDALHWLSTDTRVWRLEAGFILIPTFERVRTLAVHDLLIRFDDRGIVRQLSRVRRRGGETEVLEFREIEP